MIQTLNTPTPLEASRDHFDKVGITEDQYLQLSSVLEYIRPFLNRSPACIKTHTMPRCFSGFVLLNKTLGVGSDRKLLIDASIDLLVYVGTDIDRTLRSMFEFRDRGLLPFENFILVDVENFKLSHPSSTEAFWRLSLRVESV